jgi:hypothetical protein
MNNRIEKAIDGYEKEELAETIEELYEKPKPLPNPTMIIRLFCKCASCKKEREK